jgi:hypothetical protein
VAVARAKPAPVVGFTRAELYQKSVVSSRETRPFLSKITIGAALVWKRKNCRFLTGAAPCWFD